MITSIVSLGTPTNFSVLTSWTRLFISVTKATYSFDCVRQMSPTALCWSKRWIFNIRFMRYRFIYQCLLFFVKRAKLQKLDLYSLYASTFYCTFTAVDWKCLITMQRILSAMQLQCAIEHSNSGKKSFDSIRFDSRYRIDFFDSIRFGNLINLPLVH